MKLVSNKVVNGKKVFRITDKIKIYLVTVDGDRRIHQKIIVPFDETETCRYMTVNSEQLIKRLNEVVNAVSAERTLNVEIC